MKNKSARDLIVCTLATGAVILVLFLLTYENKRKYSSFNRTLARNKPIKENIIDLKFNSYYFAGVDSNNIYLGNRTAPFHLVSLNHELSDTHHVRILASSQGIHKPSVKILAPYFFLFDGVTPSIKRGQIGIWKAEEISSESPYFTAIEPISRSSFAVRSLNSEYKSQLAKTGLSEDQFQWASNILIRQVDGMFCVDGMMHYNTVLKKLLYVYYYRNQFILMDSALKLEYRGRCIDTIAHAKIKVRWNKEKNNFVRGAALTVNRLSFSYGKLLFINSAISAKNENEEEFQKSSRIDVYHLKYGHYLSSFYIPNVNEKKLSEFTIEGDRFFAVFDHFLVTFRLSELMSEFSKNADG